ncbi:MAG: porin family protein [Bacteroidota bacterium]
MQATNFWNKLNIRRTKVVVILLLGFIGCPQLLAQRSVELNNPNYDNRFLSYGFLIGLHTSTYQLKYSQEFVDDLDSVYSISPRFSPGFSLGFIVNFRASDFLDVRLLPTVAFYEHELEYQFLDEPTQTELVETTVVEFPVLLKYKSERRGNTRMYMVGGIKPGIEASGKNDIQEGSDDNLNINQFNLSLDIGFGIDIYYPLFKFSPEIRFSRGITNMLEPNNSPLSAGIDRLNTNTITLFLLFQ